MVTHPSLERLAQQLQRRALSLQRWAVGLDVVLGALTAALVLPWLIKASALPISQLTVYSVITALAIGVFVLRASRLRADAMAVLVQADRVLGLHETLSTAYEYQHQHASNPFVPGLLNAAVTLVPRVDIRHILPRRYPRRLWGIPCLLAAIIASPLLSLTSPWSPDLASQDMAQEISREGQRLEQWGRELEEVARREQLDRSRVLARQIQQLGQRLQREGGEKTQVTERISTLSQYLQRLQQELHERALMNEAMGASAQDVFVSNKNVKQELRDILHLLHNDASPRDLAAAAEQSVLRLSRQVGQNPQLDALLNNLRAGDLDAARQVLQEVLGQQQAAEELEHLDRARRALEYSARAIQRGAQPETSAGRTRSPQSDNASQGAMEFGDEDMSPEHASGMDDMPMHGAEEGHGSSSMTRQHSPHTIQESDQPPSNVDVKSGEGARRLSYVRALPLQNEAHVPFEQVVVQYQHAAESVLTQEQMPRGYREQIKQYFLSLGMMK